MTESAIDKIAADVPDSVSISPDAARTTEKLVDPPDRTNVDVDRAVRSTDASGAAMSELEAPSSLIRKAEARIEEVLEEIDELKRSVRLLGQAIPQREGRHSDIYSELVGQGVDPEFVGEPPCKRRQAESKVGQDPRRSACVAWRDVFDRSTG